LFGSRSVPADIGLRWRPDHQLPQRPHHPVLDATRDEQAADPVRNGNRWRVYAIDPEHNRIAARRLDDDARAAFTGDYLSEHITHGYAVTVHSAQGVTANTTHAVLGENTTRALAYVAMTRGRESNTAYLYPRIACEADHEHSEREDIHVVGRGSGRDAAHLLRDIIAAHDERARTAHDVSSGTEREHLPESVGSLVDRRTTATERRRRDYLNWHEQTQTGTPDTERWREQQVSRTLSRDYGIQL
jgi:hypothetical protein